MEIIPPSSNRVGLHFGEYLTPIRPGSFLVFREPTYRSTKFFLCGNIGPRKLKIPVLSNDVGANLTRSANGALITLSLFIILEAGKTFATMGNML